MNPATICQNYLGELELSKVLSILTIPQLRAILRSCGIKLKQSGGFVSSERRRNMWTSKITAALANDRDDIATALLQQWLLNHQRPLLIAYLDSLGVPHSAGETEHTFLRDHPVEMLREQASHLLVRFKKPHVLAYLHFIAHQQDSQVFESWQP